LFTMVSLPAPWESLPPERYTDGERNYTLGHLTSSKHKAVAGKHVRR
jgi:hypothetical protein